MPLAMKTVLKSTFLATVVGLTFSVAQAQEKPKPTAEQTKQVDKKQSKEKPAEKADKPQEKTTEQDKNVEITAPSEQTQDVAGGVTVPEYRDDRSTPQTLIESYYNAINRKEYARAYDYFTPDGREPDFQRFIKGYEKTKSVKVAVRKVDPDPGAGQIYWSQPLAIEAERADGSKEVFSGCYTIHLTNPEMQDAAPYKPMAIVTGSLTKSPLELEKSVPEACEAP